MPTGEDSSSSKRFSVVVAAVESERSIASCLAALSASIAELDTEVIVVEAGNDPATAREVERYPNARLVSLESGALTPRLWSEGLALASGEIVALTTGHCIASHEWGRSLIAGFDGGAAAVGGPLRLEANSSAVDAAIFFLRYSAFVEGKKDGDVSDIAGDNAAYLRNRIPATEWSRAGGFWETRVNGAIRQSGQSIVWQDSAVVGFGRSFSLRSICRHRFAHGRLFGRERVTTGKESAIRLLAAAPLVPFVLAVRIAQRVWGRPAYRARYLLSLPLILVIAGCWAAGEGAGAMDGWIADRR